MNRILCLIVMASLLLSLQSCRLVSVDIPPNGNFDEESQTLQKDTAELEKTLRVLADEAERYKAESYTKESYIALKDSLARVKAVLDSSTVTAEQISDCISELDFSVDGLIARSDILALQSVCEKAKALDEDRYSKASYAFVKQTLNEAEKAIDDVDTPQSMVDYITAKLGYYIDILAANPVAPKESTDESEKHCYLLGLPADAPENPISAENSEKLDTMLKSFGNGVGCMAYDLKSGFTVSYNPYMKFFAASTVKASDVLYIYLLADNGKASLDDEWEYLPRHYNGSSGTIQSSPFGTVFTLREISKRAIRISDNAGYYMLLNCYGIDGFNSYIKNLGCTVAGEITEDSKYGFSCAMDAALVWKEIYTYTKTGKHGDFFRDNLENAVAPIISYAVTDSPVAHKSGWSELYYNDVAVVYADRPYIISMFSKRAMCSHNTLVRLASLLSDIMEDYREEK